jgi:hypothetical protein
VCLLPQAKWKKWRKTCCENEKGGVVSVNVQPGEYPVTGTFELSAEDSGTQQGPVVYRAVEPAKAVFYGGRRIAGFQPVTDPVILARLPEAARGKVQSCDLRAQGITDR